MVGNGVVRLRGGVCERVWGCMGFRRPACNMRLHAACKTFSNACDEVGSARANAIAAARPALSVLDLSPQPPPLFTPGQSPGSSSVCACVGVRGGGWGEVQSERRRWGKRAPPPRKSTSAAAASTAATRCVFAPHVRRSLASAAPPEHTNQSIYISQHDHRFRGASLWEIGEGLLAPCWTIGQRELVFESSRRAKSRVL